jgi:FkbM family methyltransferase
MTRARRQYSYPALWRHMLDFLLKKPFVRARKQARLLLALGFWAYLRLCITRKGHTLQISVGEFRGIVVRKGTTDIEVALTSLGGEFSVLADYLEPDYDGVIVDGGGYIGTAAIALSAMFPGARVLTVEPSSENLEVLRSNIKGWPMITLVEGAIVAGTRESAILRDRGTGEWGFSIVSDSQEKGKFLHSVPAISLDSLGGNNEIGLLKLDIEGGEFELFQENSQALRDIPIIFAELHDEIVTGCTDEFKKFSESREHFASSGEKWLSIRI